MEHYRQFLGGRINQMAAKEPVDTKAAIFAVCAALFVFAVGFASVYHAMR
jgi:hypothetical protein